MRRIFKIIALLAVLLTSVSGVFAQDIVTLEGEYTLHGDGRLSPADCKRLALENARVEALRNEFGTIVSQDVMATESDRDDASRFLALTSSEVKGEWLGDIGEPKYDINLDSNGNLVVKCTVKGRARRLSNEAPEFDAKVLRNGTDPKRFADTNFRDKDDLFVYFSAPVAGYLNIYLADETGTVYCMLPYPRSDVSEIKTKRGYDYIFFDDTRAGGDFGNADGMQMYASDGVEYNKLYVIFSPNNFAQAPTKFGHESGFPTISQEEFDKWLIKSRRNDPKMGVKSMNLIVSPR